MNWDRNWNCELMARFTVLTIAVFGGVVPAWRTAGPDDSAPAPDAFRAAVAARHRRPVATPARGGQLADVAERINAAVVSIDAASRAGRRRRRRGDDPTGRAISSPAPGSGSGFIGAGFHSRTTENADRITVTLADGRAMKAKSSARIRRSTSPSSGGARAAAGARSATRRSPVGVVCAIGNPLGYALGHGGRRELHRANCSTRAWTTTSRPTPPSTSATAAAPDQRAAKSSASTRRSARGRPTSVAVRSTRRWRSFRSSNPRARPGASSASC